MKTKTITKKVHTIVALGLIGMLSFTSCNKDENTDSNEAITEQEAVDEIEASLSKESNGVSKSVETAMTTADEDDMFTDTPSVDCGLEYQDTFIESYQVNGYSYYYAVTRNLQLNCNENEQLNYVDYVASLNGDYETPRLISENVTNIEWQLADIHPNYETVTFEGLLNREGRLQSKVRNMNNFNGSLSMNVQNLVVDKTTYQIMSGTGNVTFIGTTSTGNQFEFSGSITFNGDDTVTLVLNGNTYTIYL